uniref:Uncharacterized protein n=1 Tax=Podoviridae sp. ct9f93 TaxID=2826544 RepID=A0A8S5NDF1_9CAUD|nr:MAG TPA: hypothetical protein [Podoviridae sp. ct9f93]
MNLQPYGKKDSLWWRTDGKTSDRIKQWLG